MRNAPLESIVKLDRSEPLGEGELDDVRNFVDRYTERHTSVLRRDSLDPILNSIYSEIEKFQKNLRCILALRNRDITK